MSYPSPRPSKPSARVVGGSTDCRWSPVACLLEICKRLDWLDDADGSFDSRSKTVPTFCSRRTRQPEYDDCLLMYLIESRILRPAISGQLRGLTRQGFTLRSRWRRPWCLDSNRNPVDSWLGARLFLSHLANCDLPSGLTTVVSSRLGRDFQNLPHWPLLLNSVLRAIHRQGDTLLLTPGATLDRHLFEWAETSNIPTATLRICDRGQNLTDWFARVVGEAVEAKNSLAREQIWISPRCGPDDDIHPQEPTGIPLRDLATVCMSDRVYGLSVRPSGNLQRLLQRRLADSQFPEASVFVALGCSEDEDARSPTDWLQHRAVGWYVCRHPFDPAQAFPRNHLADPCRQVLPNFRPTWQLCLPFPDHWTHMSEDQWIYLSHCTRGTSGPLPNESESNFFRRLWLQGHMDESHPLFSLNRICQTGLLRGSSRITRSERPCVSFSQVPLPRLLKRRKFRSHLGRWDWEPYGIFIERSVLEQLGMRPVIYGDEQVFAELSSDLKPFFQSRGTTYDWTQEREWRILGDIDLRQLPKDSVHIFTRTRSEATYLAQRYPWSVFWNEETSPG